MNITEKVAIFIDGSNLYYKLKDKKISLENTAKFNFLEFAKWLARDRKIVFRSYYIGVVRAKSDDAKAQKMRRRQQQLFSHLMSKKQGFEIKRGFMMKNDDGIYHEKGVDVHLATDLLVGAYENLWDTAILVSSDTDLIPAIEKVKKLGKNVEYIGFAHKPSLGLQRYANISRLLIKDEIKVFEYKSDLNRET